jgi:hypothetical protein
MVYATTMNACPTTSLTHLAFSFVATMQEGNTCCDPMNVMKLSKVLKPLLSHFSVLTLKILSDQIWVAGYFGQPLTYPYFTIFSSDFLCNSLKS